MKTCSTWISLVVQWLRLCISTVGAMSLIPGQGTKISHAVWQGQKKKKSSTSFIIKRNTNENRNQRNTDQI